VYNGRDKWLYASCAVGERWNLAGYDVRGCTLAVMREIDGILPVTMWEGDRCTLVVVREVDGILPVVMWEKDEH
jgi:hypothetical protein